MPDRLTVLIADFLDERPRSNPRPWATSHELALAGDGHRQARPTHLPPGPTRSSCSTTSQIPGRSHSFAHTLQSRGVVRAGVGYNNINLEAATRRGVVVCNVPDYGTEEVADHAIKMLRPWCISSAVRTRRSAPGTMEGRTAVGGPPAPRQDLRRWSAAAGSAPPAPCTQGSIRARPHVLLRSLSSARGWTRPWASAASTQLDELLEQSHYRQPAFLPRRGLTPPDQRPGPIARMRQRPRPTRRAARSWMRTPCSMPSTRATSHPRRASMSSSAKPLDNQQLQKAPILLTPARLFYSVEGYRHKSTKRPPRRSAASSWASRRGTVNVVPRRGQTASS